MRPHAGLQAAPGARPLAGCSVTLCSYRLGGTDGVSVEAEKWAHALRAIGCRVQTVAGAGRADLVLPGLAAHACRAPGPAELEAAFAGAQVVVVENLCSLPLNPAASAAVARALAGRPAILHHHDLALERRELAHHGPPPADPAWTHVCISDHARARLARHSIAATTIRNAFEPDPAPGERASMRAELGVGARERLLLQPTRAIARKNVPRGLALAEALGATFWLTGPAEDGYGTELDALVARARCRVLRRPMRAGPRGRADAYAACDLVALPSDHEGFGNPAIEAATHRRPLAIGRFPVAEELAGLGFAWFDAEDPGPIAAFLDAPDAALLAANAATARRHLSLEDLPKQLELQLLRTIGAGTIRAQ